MKKGRFTEEQIIGVLKKLESGVKADDLAREMGVSKQTIWRWRSKYGGMDVSDAKKLKALEHENTRLKRMVADLSLDKQMLQDVLSREW